MRKINKKSIKLDVSKIIEDVIEEGKGQIINHILRKLTSIKEMPTYIFEVLGESFEKALVSRIKDVDGYVNNEFNKYFLENLNYKAQTGLKKFVENNETLNNKADESMKKYFDEIDFHTIMFNFLENKRELFMELFMKNMFKDKK